MKFKYSVLIVEDEPETAEYLKMLLQRDGYRATVAYTADSGMQAIRDSLPDIILLDLMLPDMSGIQLCRILKQDKKFSHIPVMMLTAMTAKNDQITGLDTGADDYIAKPFLADELLARLRAVIRRVIFKGKVEELLQIGELNINATQRKVFLNQKEIALTLKEFELIFFLARRAGQIFTPAQIVEHLGGLRSDIHPKSLKVYINRLRKKLGKMGEKIESVRGLGYRFNNG